MRLFSIVVALVALFAVFAGASREANRDRRSFVRLFTKNEEHQRFMWQEYIRTYAKSYSSPAIAESRFKNFIANLKLADERNEKEVAAGGEPVHGITKFFDQDAKEFQQYFLGAKPELKQLAASTNNASGFHLVAPASNQPVKDGQFVNWAGIYTTPVKNQGE